MRTISKVITALPIIALTGCMTIPPEQLPITTEKREFIYDFSIPNTTKKQLFKSARNYLASSYGDSKEISRVEDEEQGIIIGKAIAKWNLSTDSFLFPYIPCYSKYDINFIAKNEKGRLRLFLVEGAIPPCSGWPLPPKRDYPQIVTEFNAIAKGLEDALKGNSEINKLSEF